MAVPATSNRDSHDWLRRSGALTVAPPAGWEVDEITVATAAAERLALHAHALLSLRVVTSGPCPADCTRCAGLTCDVVRALVAAFPLPFSEPQPLIPDGDAALVGYRRALAEIGAAVHTCRRTLHLTDHCLFGESREDLCGRVLAAAHRLD